VSGVEPEELTMPTTYRISIKLIKERDVGKYRVTKIIRDAQYRGYQSRFAADYWWGKLLKLLNGFLPDDFVEVGKFSDLPCEFSNKPIDSLPVIK
jgi:hypothetical protein